MTRTTENRSVTPPEQKEKRVPSPCVGICILDGDDYCTGCGRSGLEIGEWGVMENSEKRAVLARIARCRREA